MGWGSDLGHDGHDWRRVMLRLRLSFDIGRLFRSGWALLFSFMMPPRGEHGFFKCIVTDIQYLMVEFNSTASVII